MAFFIMKFSIIKKLCFKFPAVIFPDIISSYLFRRKEQCSNYIALGTAMLVDKRNISGFESVGAKI